MSVFFSSSDSQNRQGGRDRLLTVGSTDSHDRDPGWAAEGETYTCNRISSLLGLPILLETNRTKTPALPLCPHPPASESSPCSGTPPPVCHPGNTLGLLCPWRGPGHSSAQQALAQRTPNPGSPLLPQISSTQISSLLETPSQTTVTETAPSSCPLSALFFSAAFIANVHVQTHTQPLTRIERAGAVTALFFTVCAAPSSVLGIQQVLNKYLVNGWMQWKTTR